jgi:hypothetical protein
MYGIRQTTTANFSASLQRNTVHPVTPPSNGASPGAKTMRAPQGRTLGEGGASMPNGKRKEYRGYRIEATLPDPTGWRVTVYRLNANVPQPLRASDIRYASAADAMAVGHRDIDWLLSKRTCLQ